jgi:hypothetical protein
MGQPEIPEDHLVDANDTEWRKYALTFVILGLLTWGFWITQFSQILQGLYVTFGGFILAGAGLFMGANIASRLQGGIINVKAYPLANGDAVPGDAKVTPPVSPTSAAAPVLDPTKAP